MVFVLCFCRHGQSRIPSVNAILRGVIKQFTRPPSPAGSQWEADFYLGGTKRLGQISRAPDGRFVVVDSSANSVSSSSDDGGFLSRPGFRNRASWRRPLVGYPSDLSLRSSASGDSLAWTPRRTPLPMIPTIYTPKITPFRASSPASSVLWSPSSALWSPAYFSDLSSVRQPSSAERTLRSVHERYSQELPSLRAIHEENQRALGSQSPRGRGGRARLPPRHARHARSAPELADLTTETSPESRSSSSGFGSKNTSQRTGSTGTGEWRLPPYRPPPPPPPPPPIIGHWLEYTSEFPSPTHSELSHKPLSVDDHYEFDPIFPASPTPTDMCRTLTPAQHIRTPKYDNIEARVQAMKEEFHAFRQRQARRRQSEEIESAC